MNRFLKRSLWFIVVGLLSTIAYSYTITHTDYSSGGTITASGQNTNENAIVNVINGNIDTTNIAASGVGTTQLAAQSVTAAKIANGVITTTHISATAGITGTQLATGAALANLGANVVFQVVQSTTVTISSTTSSSYILTTLNATITPSVAAHRIKISIYTTLTNTNPSTGVAVLSIDRSGTNLANSSSDGFVKFGGAGIAATITIPVSYVYVDRPNTTSAITYSVDMKNNDNGTAMTLGINNITQVMILEELGNI